MRRVFLILAVAFSATACQAGEGSSSSESKSTVGVAPAKEAHGVEYLTNETFKAKVFDYEVNKEWNYKGDLPAIVDFYADWCGPCRMIAPVLEDLSKEYNGKIVIYKVNTDQQKELAAAFGIRSLPSILFIPKNGQPQLATGAMPKESFVQAINEVLLNKAPAKVTP